MKYHKKKSLFLKTLDLLPQSLGYYLYHLIQAKSFRDIDSHINANVKSIEVIANILKKSNINLEGANVLEIGSGWLPLMPFLFKKHLGIKKVYTYDINKHYSNDRIYKTAKHFAELNYKNYKSQGLNLPDFIDYYPNINLVEKDLPLNVKLYYSRFVLEHVDPNFLHEMHKKLYDQMDSGARILHLISPSDHRAYSDKSLSHYDFLKYSHTKWTQICTKFDYHNRYRLPQYLSVFESIGFKVEYLSYDKVSKTSEKYNKFKDIEIHSDFSKFNEEELLAGSIHILLKK